jgi:hypothetical protein
MPSIGQPKIIDARPGIRVACRRICSICGQVVDDLLHLLWGKCGDRF